VSEVVYTSTPGEHIPEDGKARVWRFQGRISTVQVGSTFYKSLSGWHGDLELCRECLEVWRSQDWTGYPSGPGSFFHKVFDSPTLCWSINAQLQPRFFGGWQEVFQPGRVEGPCWYYDIVNAYLWAGLQELPTRLRPYQPGDRRWLGIVELGRMPVTAPRPLQGERVLADWRDVETYGLDVRRIPWAVSWKEEDETNVPVWEAMKRVHELLPPRAFKLSTQSYWGRWASGARTEDATMVDGETVRSRQLRNPFQNFPWATLIVHRVMRKAWRASRRDAVLAIVDAVLKTSQMRTGTKPGDWSLKEQVPGDVYVKAPGVWDVVPVGENFHDWKKHAGFSDRDGLISPEVVEKRRTLKKAQRRERLWRSVERQREAGETQLSRAQAQRQSSTGPGQPSREHLDAWDTIFGGKTSAYA
jgi:hypothetical protein